MKIRADFVTNSSSSSFVLVNKSDHDMTAEEFMLEVLKPVIDDAKKRKFTIPANGQYVLECGDHCDDGSLENFIHYLYSNDWEASYCGLEDETNELGLDAHIKFLESNH